MIFAASIEWMGIGGYLQQFLDSCWLYGDKSKISTLYMFPVVISTTYGEKDANLMLTNAWELLGGKICDGICAYVEDSIDFEGDSAYGTLIEKKTENLYRTISKKLISFPPVVLLSVRIILIMVWNSLRRKANSFPNMFLMIFM